MCTKEDVSVLLLRVICLLNIHISNVQVKKWETAYHAVGGKGNKGPET